MLTFKKDSNLKQTLFKRLDSGIGEKDIPLEEIKSIEKFKKHSTTLMIQLKYVACSVQSGSVLLLDAESEAERDSWVEEIEKLVLTNARGGLNLVREEISESIHKYYDFKLKTNEGVLVGCAMFKSWFMSFLVKMEGIVEMSWERFVDVIIIFCWCCRDPA